MIDLKNTENIEFKETRKFIEAGIREVKITSIINTEGTNGKSGRLSFEWVTTDGKTAQDSLFTSEGAIKYTLATVKHLVKEITGTDVNVTGKDYTEFAKNLYKLIGNKMYRQKFHGKEVAGKEGKKSWWQATFGPVMATNRLAENISVPIGSTQLRFNPTSNFDMKSLVTPDATTVHTNGTSMVEDLPF